MPLSSYQPASFSLEFLFCQGQCPNVGEIEETLDTSTMSQRHIYCMTLRLEPRIEELVAEAAYDRGLTRSDWIRMAIRLGLRAQQEQHGKRRDPK